MNRRAFIAAAPAVALAGPVAAETETPVAALFREWRDYHAWLNGPETNGMGCSEFNVLCEHLRTLEAQIMGAPSLDARDTVMKAVALSYYGDEGLPSLVEAPDFWAEARALVAA